VAPRRPHVAAVRASRRIRLGCRDRPPVGANERGGRQGKQNDRGEMISDPVDRQSDCEVSLPGNWRLQVRILTETVLPSEAILAKRSSRGITSSRWQLRRQLHL
jgi:hypothetical protein